MSTPGFGDLRVSLGRYDEDTRGYEAQIQVGYDRPLALSVGAARPGGELFASVEFRSMRNKLAAKRTWSVSGETAQQFIANLKRAIREEERSGRELALPVARGQWNGGKLNRSRRVTA